MKQYTFIYKNSSLGDILLVSDGTALTGLYFDGAKDKEVWKSIDADKDTDSRFHSENIKRVQGENKQSEEETMTTLPVFVRTCEWLDIYFSGKKPDFFPELSMQGSEFQRRVWEILKEIPYGETISYGDIAKRIAAERGIPRMSARAVGGAVGSNPVSIIVPCHRVVGSNGNLTGYGGGMDKKIGLLTLEGVDMHQFTLPKVVRNRGKQEMKSDGTGD